MSIESVMPSSHLILCRPLLLLPPIPPSIRVFSNETALRMRWPKYWSFSLSIIPSKEIPGLISFRMDWWDLLAVQGTLKSLLQHHSSKASILQHSARVCYLQDPYINNVLEQWSSTFQHQEPVSWKTIFTWSREGRFWKDSSILHLFYTLFLLLLYQFHLRSPGIRFQRLGTPALENEGKLVVVLEVRVKSQRQDRSRWGRCHP